MEGNSLELSIVMPCLNGAPKPKEPFKNLRKKYIPPKDHPWRNFRLPTSLDFEEKEETLVGAL